jgi:orotate phosphoribosyltransferase
MSNDLNYLLTRLARTYEFREQPFTLSSQEESHEYLDCRSALSDPQTLTYAARILLDVLDASVEAIGGLTMGADPLAIGTSLISNDRGNKKTVRWFSVRKEAKAHGTGRQIEGFFRQGAKVAILEDVSTSGASAMNAVWACTDAGMTVVQVIPLVNRGGVQRELRGGPVTPIIEFADVGLIGQARQLAIKVHGDKLYGEDPYSAHLDEVVEVLADMCPYMPHLFAAGWLHDVPEDTAVKVPELRERFPAKVVDLVDACTDGPGQNRRERKERPLTLIPQTMDGIVIKLADRIANVERCTRGLRSEPISKNLDLLKMYRKEHSTFVERLQHSPASFDVTPMWDRLGVALIA